MAPVSHGRPPEAGARPPDHALAYPEPPASPLWHRSGPTLHPLTPEQQQRNTEQLLHALEEGR